MSGITDYQTARNWRSRFIPATSMGLIFTGNLDAVPPTVTAVTVRSYSAKQGTSNMVYVDQLGSSGLTGLRMDTNGVVVKGTTPIADVDPFYNLYFRIWWATNSVTTADTVLWTLTQGTILANSGVAGVSLSALTSAIPQDTVGAATALTMYTTGAGYLSAPSPGVNIDEANNLLAYQIAMTTKAAGLTEELWLYGLEMLYMPHILGTAYGQGAAPELPSGWS